MQHKAMNWNNIWVHTATTTGCPWWLPWTVVGPTSCPWQLPPHRLVFFLCGVLIPVVLCIMLLWFCNLRAFFQRWGRPFTISPPLSSPSRLDFRFDQRERERELKVKFARILDRGSCIPIIQAHQMTNSFPLSSLIFSLQIFMLFFRLLLVVLLSF